ncbi:Cytoplasmic GTPase/eEF2-like protein (ribosomal biogenesis), partial [Coemansia spiralis]
EKVDKVIEALAIKILPRDRRSKDRRMLLMAVMQGWLPLAQACMVAIAEQLPSPVDAQPRRLPHLVQSDVRPAADQPAAGAVGDVERALFACAPGTAEAPVPAVAYVGKIVSVPRASLPEFAENLSQRSRMTMSADEMRARGREEVRRELTRNRESANGTPLSALSLSGTGSPAPELTMDALAEDVESGLRIDGSEAPAIPEADPDADEDEVLVGFSRLYSGTISVGDRLWAMQPKYNAKDLKTHSYLKQITVRGLYLMMGREFVQLQTVSAGSVFGIRGVAGAILKSGTLASDAQACPNLAAMHTESHPIVRVALEPTNPQDLPRLVRGLELLNQADPCVHVISQATGESVLVAAGELHLERCLKDLRERFALCEIQVSEPIVPFREGIVRQPAKSGVVLGEVGASGRQLAIIAKQTPSSTGATPVAADSTPRGEVSLTTANGLVTIVVRVEPLPEATTNFLVHHESDIQRVVRLTSLQRRQRLNAAAEALDDEDEDDAAVGLAAAGEADSGVAREARPSRLSEMG